MKKLYHFMITTALLSVLIATTWVIITRDQYRYNVRVLQIGDSLLFPLVAWILGLLFLAALFYSLHARTRHALIVTIAFYWIAVIVVETVAYHSLGIMNIGTSNYPGLPLCDCLHAPPWMQLGYFTNGVILLVTLWFLNTFTHWLPNHEANS